MRAVLQRVKRASVTVEGNITGAIEDGLLVLLGIEEADTLEDMNWLALVGQSVYLVCGHEKGQPTLL